MKNSESVKQTTIFLQKSILLVTFFGVEIVYNELSLIYMSPPIYMKGVHLISKSISSHYGKNCISQAYTHRREAPVYG